MKIGLIDVDGHNWPSAPKVLRDIQRWCNNKIIFGACPYFEDYKG